MDRLEVVLGKVVDIICLYLVYDVILNLLGHSGITLLISNLGFETKSGREGQEIFTKGISF